MDELRKHPFSAILVWVYERLGGRRRRTVANFIFGLLYRLEGGHFLTFTVRHLLARDYATEIAAHSYGECFTPGAFAPSVKVGKYVSVAKGVRVFTQNHPIDWLSTHPYFYEKQFHIVDADLLAPASTEIGHDIWIGQGAIVLPGCKKIGTGSIIGAGAVVTRDVPPYSVVAGNPARVLKYRFSESRIEQLLQSEWWNAPVSRLAELRDELCLDLTQKDLSSLLIELRKGGV